MWPPTHLPAVSTAHDRHENNVETAIPLGMQPTLTAVDFGKQAMHSAKVFGDSTFRRKRDRNGLFHTPTTNLSQMYWKRNPSLTTQII